MSMSRRRHLKLGFEFIHRLTCGDLMAYDLRRSLLDISHDLNLNKFVDFMGSPPC